MRCSSAKWRGAQCVGQIQAALIISEGHMPKNTTISQDKIGLRKIRTPKSHGFVNCMRLVSVNFRKTTNMVANYKNTSVPFV